MRYHEIASGMPVPLFSEEQELLDRIGDKGIANDALDERDQEVARQMVSRGLLDRFRPDGKAEFYRPSTINDIWRDRS